WNTRFARLSIGSEPDGNGHEPSIECDVKQFLSVPPPADLRAAIRGNLQLAAGTWKRLDEYFDSARFVRLIRNPFSVRRELSVPFFKRRLHNWKRFWLSAYGQGP